MRLTLLLLWSTGLNSLKSGVIQYLPPALSTLMNEWDKVFPAICQPWEPLQFGSNGSILSIHITCNLQAIYAVILYRSFNNVQHDEEHESSKQDVSMFRHNLKTPNYYC
ncbi:hypothetical protein EON65_38630 [archaeon]|nr:MAG: hypothetical protein EON65_38630 [archaeon]